MNFDLSMMFVLTVDFYFYKANQKGGRMVKDKRAFWNGLLSKVDMIFQVIHGSFDKELRSFKLNKLESTFCKSLFRMIT